MKKLKYITTNPKICGGKPCFRGTRIPVSVVLNYIGAGDSIDTVLENYPDLARKHILEAIRFAAHMVNFEEMEIPA
jgi:uncharacterized protein (DUF433 family)